jgi:hypothetical protein
MLRHPILQLDGSQRLYAFLSTVFGAFKPTNPCHHYCSIEAADLLTSDAMNPGLGGFVNNMDFLVLQGV